MSTGGTQNVGGISASMELDLTGFDAQMQAAGQKMEEVRAKLAALDAAMKAGTIGPKQYAQALADLQAEEQAVIASAGELGAALGRAASATVSVGQGTAQLKTGFAQASAGGQKFGQTLLQIGQMADDAQYGFRGIANNIPMLFMAAGPAAMGAAAIVATATNQIINHWDDITAAFEELFQIEPPDEHLAALDAMTQHLEELKKAAETSAVAYRQLRQEQQELDQAQEAARNVAGIKPEPTPEVEAVGDATRQAIAQQGGGPALEERLLATYMQTGQIGTVDPEVARLQNEVNALQAREIELRRRSQAGDIGADIEHGEVVNQLKGGFLRRNWGEFYGMEAGGKEAELQKALNQREADARKQIRGLIDAATKGDADARRQIAEVMQQQPGLFPAGGIEAFNQAGAAHTAEVKKAFEDEVQRRAQQMAQGELGTSALSQAPVSEADVRQRLAGAGLTPKQVEAQAGPVFAKFGQLMGEELRGRAAGRNISPEMARMELLTERIDKAGKDGAGGGRSVEDTQLRDQQRAADQAATERARQLAGGELGLRALSQAPVTEADVRQRLGQAGLTPQQVEAQAGPVFAGFAKLMEAQIQGRAISEGTDLNTARAELLSERIAKANDDPNKIRQAEDPEDLMRQLMRLQLQAQPEARGMEFVSPAEMAARVQMAANQPEDRQLRAMLDIAENSAAQVKILEKIQGGVPAVAT